MLVSIAGPILDPFLRVPAAVIGGWKFSPSRLFVRIGLVAILAAALSVIIATMLADAAAILPSDKWRFAAEGFIVRMCGGIFIAEAVAWFRRRRNAGVQPTGN